ncbi:unnamed protein product [Caenorhabditis brenneri]
MPSISLFIFLLLKIQLAQLCAPKITPEDYFTTTTTLDNLPLTKTTVKMIAETTTTERTTTVAVAECAKCAIEDILHDTVSSIEYTDPTSDGCKQIDAKCDVADSCTGGFLYAKNQDEETEIGNRSDSMIIARLTCGAKGKWRTDTAENIQQLWCSFECGGGGGYYTSGPEIPPGSGGAYMGG